MKIAILTRPEDASPKILALGLQAMLGCLGVRADMFEHGAGVLRRLLPLAATPRFHSRLHFRLRQKLQYWHADMRFLRRLRDYDAVIVSDCCPNAFWKGYYDIEKLRQHVPGKPVLLYEVYYLGNAPRQINRLRQDGDFGIERYDWHLAVSTCTEIRSKPGPGWTAIGLNLQHARLQPCVKNGFAVLVDFPQPGYEAEREMQFAALKLAGIEPIVLRGHYSVDEIRAIYRRTSVFLMAFPEAFGVSLAECLSTGAYIFTPNSDWPMAWRLNDAPESDGSGVLPEIFVTYSSTDDLARALVSLRQRYHPQEDPFRVFNSFRRTYPHFYEGDLQALDSVLARFNIRGNVS
jgi:hypothetical protein